MAKLSPTRSHVNWHDILPKQLADYQEAWERRHSVRRYRETTGATLKQIGKLIGVSAPMVRILVWKATIELEEHHPAPCEAYMNVTPFIPEVRALYEKLQRRPRKRKPKPVEPPQDFSVRHVSNEHWLVLAGLPTKIEIVHRESGASRVVSKSALPSMAKLARLSPKRFNTMCCNVFMLGGVDHDEQP